MARISRLRSSIPHGRRYKTKFLLVLLSLFSIYLLLKPKKQSKSSIQPPLPPSQDGKLLGILHELERDIEGLFHPPPIAPSTSPPHTTTTQHQQNTQWKSIQSSISTHPDGNRFLIGWPTIPVSHKGSDSRALDAIKFLTKIGFSVDLIYWRDFATESNDPSWDDTADRDRLIRAGVKRILGPFDKTKLSDTHTFVSSYFAFLFWLWPDGPFLECLHDFANHIKKMNGRTRLVAAVDDTGVAVRNLFVSCRNGTRGVEDSEKFLLKWKRHPDLLGNEAEDFFTKGITGDVPTEDEYLSYRSETYLLHLEMFLYVMADVTVGLNGHIAEYLSQLVPGTPSKLLSYISPVQPSLLTPPAPYAARKDILFFGYDNPANRNGLMWFYTNVLPYIAKNTKLHIAGMVSVPEICLCKEERLCTSLHLKVVCHGALSDDGLEKLIRGSLVAINPVLEPSGVATKTCRAMAHGTPVVVSDLDGTFDDQKSTDGAKRCSIRDSQCTAIAINTFLLNEKEWTKASHAASQFIENEYGTGPYTRDWMSILEVLLKKQIEVLIDGDARYDGQSMAAQNWHITKTLSSMPEFHVTVMGTLDPPIKNVNRVDPPDLTPYPLPDHRNGGLWPNHQTHKSPFETGFQANIILRQKWPPSINSFPLKYCGPGCRIAQILPWEFGSLPKVWMKQLPQNIDWLWAPSEYNRLIFENSKFDRSRTAVTPAGIDCKKLNTLQTKPIAKKTNDPITFIFTGGLLPRKGVDIILEEWSNLFCNRDSPQSLQSANKVKLILHTSYELGYTNQEMSKMESIVKRCGNVDFMRKKWMDRDQHLDMLRQGDIYIAPFRSEGFGIPIVEAMILGLYVIASVGNTAADDYLHLDPLRSRAYPVSAKEVECTHEPCEGNKLCVFDPCWDRGKDKGWKCSCETLVETPIWFEVQRVELRKQMKAAYQDVSGMRLFGFSEGMMQLRNHTHEERPITSFCWEELASTYRERVVSVVKSQRKRVVGEYVFVRPREFRRREKRLKALKVIGILVVIVGCVVWVFGKKGIRFKKRKGMGLLPLVAKMSKKSRRHEL